MPSLGDLVVNFSANTEALTAGITEGKRQFVSIGDIARLSAENIEESIARADESVRSLGTVAKETAATTETALASTTDKIGSLSPVADQASGGFLSSLSSMGSGILNFANNATMMGQTILQWGGALQQGLSHASDFESSITALETGAGEFHKNLGLVSSGILDMTGQVGESTQQLTSGMYLIESAGQHGSQALTTLKDAAEGAKVGSADLASVANGVTTAMTDYSASGLTASQATNDLIATVAAGKTHMADLASSFSSILPTAASVKVSFTDVSAALATMTGEGTPAADAATYLRQTLMSLENPAAAGASALKNIGLTTKQVSDDMRVSLPDTLKLITDHLKSKFPEGSAAYVKALADISGGSRQMQGVLELTGSHLKVFEGNLTTISGAVKKGGDSITGWAQVQGDFNQKIDQAKGAVEALMINLGSKLLPVVGKIVDAVTPLIGQFGTWITSGSALNTVIGNLATGAFYQISAIVQGLVVPALQGFWQIAQKVIAYLNSDAFAGVIADFQTLGNQIEQLLIPAIQQIGPLIMAAFAAIGPVLTGTIIPAIDTVVFELGQFVSWLNQSSAPAQAVKDVLLGIGAAFAVIQIGAFIATIPALVAGFIAWGVAAWSAAIATIAATWPILAIGAAIAIVVAGIILAVQHWGEISKWLQDRWKDVQGFFAGLWKGIQGIWGGIGNWFQQRFSDAQKAATSVWSGIVSFFQGVWNAVVATVQTFVTTIVNAFHWLYDHNTYVKETVDNITHWFSDAGQLLATIWGAITSAWNATTGAIRSAWNAVATWLTGSWNATKSTATSVWDAISSAIMGPINAAIGWLHSVWNAATAWLGGVWNGFVGLAQAAWSAVSGVFAGIWTNYIAGPLQSLWDSIAGWFGNLAQTAIQWGANIITGILNGIKGAIGQIGNFLHGALGGILGNLGFHGLPGFAMGGTTPGGPILVGERGPEILSPPSGYTVTPLTSSALFSSVGSSGGGDIHVHNHIYLDGKEVTNQVMTRAMKEIRRQGVRAA